MNVLMFTRCMGAGGTEKVILQLCKALMDAGNKVIVCAASGEGVQRLKVYEIPFIEIEDIQKKDIRTAFRVIKTISSIVKNEEIDIVHTHHRMAAFYIRLIGRFLNVKMVNTIHNTFEDKRLLTRWSFNGMYNIAVGKAVKDNMVNDFKVKEDKIQVIYNAIDNADISIQQVEFIDKLKNDYFVVGNIGRINTQKGFEYYVKAAEVIKSQQLPIKLLIIGEGVLREKIEQLVKDKQVDDCVIFMGFQNNILNIIRQLDLVVLSSLWEGFPLTPIEVFSMGKTIVATNVPGTLEIVDDNIDGLIVPKEDGKAIAEAIIKLYNDTNLKNRLERNALAKYYDMFSYQAFCKQYFDMYKTL